MRKKKDQENRNRNMNGGENENFKNADVKKITFGNLSTIIESKIETAKETDYAMPHLNPLA